MDLLAFKERDGEIERTDIGNHLVFGSQALGHARELLVESRDVLERIEVEKDFAITGGIGKNNGIVERIEGELGLKSLVTEYDSQIAGALGAALFGQVLEKKRRKAA